MTLFDSYRHHALFTTTDKQTMGTVAADKTHRGHAIIEQVHADLKAGPLAHLPSGVFTANSAWLVLAVIAFNLTRATGLIADRGGRLARANDRDDSPHTHLSAGTTGTDGAPHHPAPAGRLALADRVRPTLHRDARTTTTGRGQLTTAATSGTTENEVDNRDETPGTHPCPQPITPRPSRRRHPPKAHRWIEVQKLHSGQVAVLGRDPDTGQVLDASDYTREFIPGTQWNIASHDATYHGSQLLNRLLGSAKFPFPKSLYAVEDALRFFLRAKPEATVLDFFSGSGTTAHAVMRLNRQDGGSRQCISITNNEVSADEQARLRKQGLRPGDLDWERLGICDYITKPRIRAAITGKTPDGSPIKGDYKFTDEFPMADGFEENAAFFTLTYESPLSVRHHRAFERIAPMLWLRAGSAGRLIDDLGDRGWDISKVYAVLENIDAADDFFRAMQAAPEVRTVFVVTNDDAAFQLVCRELASDLHVVQLYESYLQNFEINQGRGF